MWLFRSLKLLIRLWLGNDFYNRILKSSDPNAESHSDTTESVAPGKSQQDGIGAHPIRLSTKHAVRIGLIILGILVFLSLALLVRVILAI